MPEEKIYRPVVEKPFLQQRYLEEMKKEARYMQAMTGIITPDERDAFIDKMIHMTGVLMENDYSQMERELPPQYYAIMGSVGQIGKTSDPDDMWAEEPHCWIKPISKEEFDGDDD